VSSSGRKVLVWGAAYQATAVIRPLCSGFVPLTWHVLSVPHPHPHSHSPSSVSVSVSVSVHRSQSKSQSQRVLVWQPASKFEPTNKAATKHMAQILLRRKSQRHRRPKERQPHNKSGRKMGHVNLPFWSYNHECRMSLGKSKIFHSGFKKQIYWIRKESLKVDFLTFKIPHQKILIEYQ